MVAKKKKTLEAREKTTIAFGYTLFALTIVTIIIGTVMPFTQLYLSPYVIKFNVAVTLVSLVAGAVLPLLVSYIVGDKATHIKNKPLHHYNGVLFGVAAYWLSTFFSIVGFGQIAWIFDLNRDFPYLISIILNGLPIIGTIVVMSIVAFVYAHRQKHAVSVLHHHSYQFVLIGSIVATLIYALTQQDYEFGVLYGVLSSVYVLVPPVLIAISYKLLSGIEAKPIDRLTHSILALSLGLIAASIVGQLIYIMPYSQYISLGAGLAVWLVYTWVLRRAK